MRIAISATTGGALGMMNGEFERSPFFLIFDTRERCWQTYHNSQNAEKGRSAGDQAAKSLERLGVKTLITGQIGSEALRVLRKNSVKVYCVETGTVNDVLGAFLKGNLIEYFAPDERKGKEHSGTGTLVSTGPTKSKRAAGDSGISEGSQTGIHGNEWQGRSGQEYHGCQRRYRTC